MKIRCYNVQNALIIKNVHVQFLVETFFTFKQVKTDEIIFHFVNKKTISELHAQFFNDPTPTDCISFPIDQLENLSYEPHLFKDILGTSCPTNRLPSFHGHHILGEIFICSEVAIEYAKKHQLSPYHELSLYMIHGLLHLLGYDDLSPSEEKIMHEEEKRCMKYLREQNALIHEPSEN